MLVAFIHIFFLVCCGLIIRQLRIKQIQASVQIMLSLVMGVGYGIFLTYTAEHFATTGIQQLLSVIGYGYLSLLKMLVIPLILVSIVHAIINLGADKAGQLKKVSMITCSMLLGMTALASLIAMGVGVLFHVGEGLSLPTIATEPSHAYKGIVDTVLQMLPSNPMEAMAKGNTIAVVIFAVLLGIAARMVDPVQHEKISLFKDFIAVLFTIVKKLAQIILRATPYATFALMALLFLEQGVILLTSMLNFIVAMYVAMFCVMLMHLLILAIAGHHPWHYLRKASSPLFVAFSTRSSLGTLPYTEDALRNQFNAKQIVSSFTPSIGATIGMNACAGIFPAMLVVMTLTVLHQPLTWQWVLMVMMVNAVASLGISGIPGTAYIAATVTLTSLNLPYTMIALVQGIDPIIDMGRTAINVNGVMTTALVTDKVT